MTCGGRWALDSAASGLSKVAAYYRSIEIAGRLDFGGQDWEFFLAALAGFEIAEPFKHVAGCAKLLNAVTNLYVLHKGGSEPTLPPLVNSNRVRSQKSPNPLKS
jgi:hypothetical protein